MSSRPSARSPAHEPPRPATRHNIRRVTPWNGSIGWLERGRHAATRCDRYAQRGLRFLYVARAWFWLESVINTT